MFDRPALTAWQFVRTDYTGQSASRTPQRQFLPILPPPARLRSSTRNRTIATYAGRLSVLSCGPPTGIQPLQSETQQPASGIAFAPLHDPQRTLRHKLCQTGEASYHGPRQMDQAARAFRAAATKLPCSSTSSKRRDSRLEIPDSSIVTPYNTSVTAIVGLR